MKVTAVVTIDFEADRFDVTDPSIEIVRGVTLDVAQAIRHRAIEEGVSIGAVNAELRLADGAMEALRVPEAVVPE